jgi:hypothetical protein
MVKGAKARATVAGAKAYHLRDETEV